MITSARWALAAGGILTVPLAYACLRALWRIDARSADARLMPALAALSIAYTVSEVIMTRVGMQSGLAPPLALFVIWQIARAVRHRTRSGWLLAGVAAGLGQIFGLHARFVLPVAAFLVLDLLLTSHTERNRTLAGAALMGLAAILAASPLIVFFVREPQWFTARASVVVHPDILANLQSILPVWSFTGSYTPSTTVPGVPILDMVQSIGFYVGLGWAVWNLPRSRMARLLLVWLAIMMLPGVLTDGPNLQRMIGIMPPTAALVGLGWVVIYRTVQRLIEPRRNGGARRKAEGIKGGIHDPLWRMVALSLILASVGWHAYLLFVRWEQTPNLVAHFNAQSVNIARALIEQSHEGPVFVERAPEADDVIAFRIMLREPPVTRLDLRKCLPLPDQRTTPTEFLILTGRDPDTVSFLRDVYPQSWLPVRDVQLWEEATVTQVEVPAGAPAPPPPILAHAQFGSGIELVGYDWSGDSITAGDTLFLTLYWRASQPIGSNLTTFTHIGTGLDGEPMIAQHDGDPCQGLYPTGRWHPGEVIRDSFAIPIPADAPPGEFSIAVGWYAFPSLEQLPLLDADAPLPDDRAVIGTIHIAVP